MDLHLVTYFVAVVDQGGITKAAQALYISQPSLSQAIRTFERRLGTTLFDRTGRRLTLTEDGRKLDGAARRILADVDRARARVAAVRDLDAGRVDLVTYSAFSIDPLVELIRRFRLRYPHIMVRVVDTDGPTGVHTALRRGAAEIGVTDLSVEHAGMITIPLVEQEMVLALHHDLAVGLSNPLPREQARELPLIVDLSDRAHAARAGGLVAVNAANVVIDCAHPAATWDLVTRGAGAAVVPRMVAEQHMPTAVTRALQPRLTRRTGLVMRSGEPSPAAAAFIAVTTNTSSGA